MPKIKQSTIDAIRQRVSLLDIAEGYTRMSRAGAQYRGLSPFNTEKTPSFYVHPEKNLFMDYSSGMGGDLLKFTQIKEGLEFAEAAEFLACKAGIPVEYEEGGASADILSLRKRLYQLHERAADWFHLQFHHARAQSVRDYWTQQRGFPLELAAEHGIGYAPVDPHAFFKAMSVDEADIEASGLGYQHGRSRFRGRLMIPIRDIQGRVVGFSARQLDVTPDDDPSREAKYVNTPETEIFHKGHLLFGLHHARQYVGEGGVFTLVEGQLDCLRCWHEGINTAVATQGTALTVEQLALMHRYKPKYVECLTDGDSAGRKAALRYIPLSLKAGLDFRFLTLPEGIDPDALLKAGGALSLSPLRARMLDCIGLIVDECLPSTVRTQDRMEVLHRVYELMDNVTSRAEQVAHIETAARLLRLDPVLAVKDFQGKKNGTSNSGDVRNVSSASNCTRDLLWLLLHHEDLIGSVAEIIDFGWLDDSIEGRLLARILADILHEAAESLTDIELNNEEQTLVANLQMQDMSLDLDSPRGWLVNCLSTMYRSHLLRKREALMRDLMEKGRSRELMLELHKVRQALIKPDPIQI